MRAAPRFPALLLLGLLVSCSPPPEPSLPEPSPPESSTRWERLPDLEIARSENPAAVLDDVVYTIGGLVSTAQGFGATNSVEGLEVGSEGWVEVESLPARRHHSMAASLDGQLYLIGGMGNEGFEPEDEAWSFRPGSGWTEVAPLPEPIGAGAAVTFSGRIYVVGGVARGVALFSYDPEADQWQALPSLATAREHIAAVVFENQIWVLGGRWGNEMHQSVEIFDPATSTWVAGPPMQEARSGFGAAVIDDRIVVAGGEVFSPTRALTSVEEYGEGGWHNLAELPTSLHGMPMVAWDDRLVVVGGSSVAADAVNPGEVWALDG